MIPALAPALALAMVSILACGHPTRRDDPAPANQAPVDARVDARPLVEGEPGEPAALEEYVRERFADARPQVVDLLVHQCLKLAAVTTHDEGIALGPPLADEIQAELSDQEEDALMYRIKLLITFCFKFSPALSLPPAK